MHEEISYIAQVTKYDLSHFLHNPEWFLIFVLQYWSRALSDTTRVGQTDDKAKNAMVFYLIWNFKYISHIFCQSKNLLFCQSKGVDVLMLYWSWVFETFILVLLAEFSPNKIALRSMALFYSFLILRHSSQWNYGLNFLKLLRKLLCDIPHYLLFTILCEGLKAHMSTFVRVLMQSRVITCMKQKGLQYHYFMFCLSYLSKFLWQFWQTCCSSVDGGMTALKVRQLLQNALPQFLHAC